MVLTVACLCLWLSVHRVLAQGPAVLNVTYTNVLSKSMDLSWSVPLSVVDRITEFQIKYSFDMDGETNFTVKTITDPSARAYQLTKLYPFVVYDIEISAKTNIYGPATLITVTTAAGVPQAAPGEVVITNVTSSSVNITWKPILKYLQGGNLTEYQIFYRTEGILNKTSVMPDQTSVVIGNLKPNSSYSLVLFGSTKLGSGKTSQHHFLTAQKGPSEPLNITAEEVTQTLATVTWLKPLEANGVIKFYMLYTYNTDNVVVRKDKYEITTGNEVLKFTINHLQPGTKYNIKVVANNNQDGTDSKLLEISTDLQMGKGKFAHTNIIVGVTIVVMILIIAIIVIVIIYQRKKQGSKNSLVELPKKEENVSLKNAEAAETYGSNNEA